MKYSVYFVNKRNNIGLSQAKLADLLGFSSQAISAWENGRSYPDLSIWSKYASILKVDLVSFIECKDEKNNNNCDELSFDASKFSENIKSLRKKYKYTQTQLAEILEVNTKTIGGWEQGVSFPSLNNFISLCSIFKLSYDELYFAIEKIEKPAKRHLNKKIFLPLIGLLLVGGTVGSTIGIIAMNKRSSGDDSSITSDSSGNSSEISSSTISVSESSGNSSEVSSSIISISESSAISSDMSSSTISVSETSSDISDISSASIYSSESSEDSSSSISESSSSQESSSSSSEQASSSAETVNYEYQINSDDSITITAIPDEVNEINIPSSIDGHEVSKVKKSAITQSKAYINQTIKTLNIPGNVEVEDFENISFHNYMLLEHVDIPKNATSISEYQFTDCISLKEMTIPSQITSIPYYLFSGCYNIQEVHIDAQLTEIRFCMFRYCYKITSVNIPDTVNNIGEWAFQQCRLLPEITLPSSLKRIESCAFYQCESLKTINIPNGTLSIEKEVFNGCTSLESIYIPSSVVFIGENSFVNCNNLTIYCEASSQPDTWSTNWNSSNCDVVWGYQ